MIDSETIFQRLYELQTGGFPLNQVLILEKDGSPCVCAFFADLEMDVFEIQFDPEGCIEIQTADLAYIAVSAGILEQIGLLLDDAIAKWDDLDDFWSEDGWRGWEGLSDGKHPRQNGDQDLVDGDLEHSGNDD